jgi:AraC-like DNA-binding protein
MNGNHSLVDALAKSKLYLEYRKAFTETTGLPLTLRPVESWQLPLRGARNENGFCALMAQQSRSCATCLQIQQQLSDNATCMPYTTACEAGISETAVPVRLGEKLIGYLQTGQVFRKKPTDAQFDRTAKMVSGWKIELDVNELKDTYLATRVVSTLQYDSMVRLLSIFSEQLALVGNQLLVQQQTAEPPVITRAKRFIDERYHEDLSLGQVAKSVNTSIFYFCKMFKRFTGLNFTEYLSSVRIEKAKNLLLNRNLRISEIAYEVGFQSLTHFNRVFKVLVGQPPTEYRELLPTR